jgi:DNA-binding transcriptional LysR family regulator
VENEERELMMDRVESMRAFVLIANFGSFARAAEQLDQSPAVVTRHIQDLESHLGTRLLNRSTRSLSLTEEGRLYLESVTHILDALDDIEQKVSDQSAGPVGLLRILAPVVFAQRNLAPVLQSYREKYPRVLPELMLTDSNFDLIAQGYDIGIVPTESVRGVSSVARLLTGTSTKICAAPSYLARNGVPENPADLKNHATLMTLSDHASGGVLRFTGPDGEVGVPLRPALVANDTEVLRQAVLNGMGIGFLPSTLVWDDVRNGHLVCLLDDYRLPGRELQIVYASRQHLPAKMRTFIDHLVSWFGNETNSDSVMDPAESVSATRSCNPSSHLKALKK